MAAEPPEQPRRAANRSDRPRARRTPLPETFFVGRRPSEAPELYTVTSSAVERLDSDRRFGAEPLDWQEADVAAMELGHALLTRLADQTPSPQLVARFVVDVVSRLPDAGFVLGSEEIWLWIHWAGDPPDWSPTEPPRRRSWLDRLRRIVRGAGP